MVGACFLAPSSAGVWGPGGCPAHPRMAARYPETEESEEAREGTAAHEYVSAMIGDGEVLEVACNGHPITQDIQDCAERMIEDAHRVTNREAVEWYVEKRLDMPDTQNFGTAGFIAIDRTAKCVWVWDYKHGHKDVAAFENWPLINYAVGAARLFSLATMRDWIFDLRIYQPRSYHGDGPAKRWVVNADELATYSRRLTDAATEAMKPDAPTRTGGHCVYCPARHACPALQQVAASAMDLSMKGMPNELTPANAGVALRMIEDAAKRLDALHTGIAAQVEAAIRGGKTVPGWSLEQGYGRERWSVDADLVFAMGDAQGVNVRKPPEPVTPAQAVKKGFDDTVKDIYSEKPTGAMKLARVDSKSVRMAFTTQGSNDNE